MSKASFRESGALPLASIAMPSSWILLPQGSEGILVKAESRAVSMAPAEALLELAVALLSSERRSLVGLLP